MRTGVAIALSIALGSSSLAGAGQREDLEPSEGFFSGWRPPDPYHAALRKALVGEHEYRKCQLVALPAFEGEWAVYVVREEGTPARLFFRGLRRNLGYEMADRISDGGRKTAYSTGSDAQEAALARIEVDAARSDAPLRDGTAHLLETVWSRMLARTRYPTGHLIGLDGVTYLVAHWDVHAGYRSGETWSPEKGSRTEALVTLSEHMAGYAQAPSTAGEDALASEARALLARLDKDDS